MRVRPLWWLLVAGLAVGGLHTSPDAAAQDLFAKWLTGASGLEEAMRQRQRISAEAPVGEADPAK